MEDPSFSPKNTERKPRADSQKKNKSSDGKKKDNRKKDGQNNSRRKAQQSKSVTLKKKIQEVKKSLKHFYPREINGKKTSHIIKELQIKSPNGVQTPGTLPLKNSRPLKRKRVAMISEYLQKFLSENPNDDIFLNFDLKPSDPDFPYEVDVLRLTLCLPSAYLYEPSVLPSILVLNPEIEKGYAVNITNGFKKIARLTKGIENDETIKLSGNERDLTTMILTLDKYLEKFFMQEKKDTIKFITFKNKGKAPRNSSSGFSPVPSSGPTKAATEGSKISPEKYLRTSKEASSKRESLVNAFKLKLGDNVRPLEGGPKCTKFKILLPIETDLNQNSSYPSLPRIWELNKALELFLIIPMSYPTSRLSISISSRFSQTLSERYAEDPNLSRNHEHNLCTNFSVLNFGDESIIYRINLLSNYLSIFCLDPEEFKKEASLLL